MTSLLQFVLGCAEANFRIVFYGMIECDEWYGMVIQVVIRYDLDGLGTKGCLVTKPL